ncbi:MAG TPA: acyl-CoA dehydrogenase C-terminal domain-containing protein, partial [Acidimicrobiia bacterium]
AEIVEFVKGGADQDPLAKDREILGQILDDVQAHLGSMVENLMSHLGGERDDIYKVGLQANPLLESMAETVIAWQMLRQAEVAVDKADSDPFYRGKMESVRWLLDEIGPRVASRRKAAIAEDGSLMDLPVEAF